MKLYQIFTVIMTVSVNTVMLFRIILLFTGYEVSGIVDDVCGDSQLQVGDRVIVYPDEDTEDCISEG